MDALSIDIDIEKLKYFELEHFHIHSTEILQTDLVNKLIDAEEQRVNKKKGVSIRDSENWTTLESAIVLIAPFKLMPLPERTIFLRDKKSKFPFWYYARLNRNGTLSLPEDFFPLFQRKYLEPLADEKTEFIFSTVEKVDAAAATGKEAYRNFTDYIQYIENVFKLVVDQTIENYVTEGFATVTNGLILLPDEEMAAAISIIELYEKILKRDKIPSLLTDFITLNNDVSRAPVSVDKLISANHLHMGQMGFNFPLSISQRKSLYTFLGAEDKVFAVNGPPGTGKTTLLQSIVANMMVESAIKGQDPAIILACSTNNQAVTNIIESFSKSNTQPGPLQGRWLPEVNGYATYLPAASKTPTELKDINYKKLSGEGIFSKLEQPDYLYTAKNYFLEKGHAYFSSPLLDIQAIVEKLQQRLSTLQTSLQQASTIWEAYQSVAIDFNASYCHAYTEQSDYYSEGMLTETAFGRDLTALSSLEKEVVSYFRNESVFRKLGCFLHIPASWRKRASELRIVLRDSLIPTPTDFSYVQQDILEKIDQKINFAKHAVKIIKEWNRWKATHAIKGNPPANETAYWEKESFKIMGLRNNDRTASSPNCFYDELDVSVRHEAFQLALHYWEGRWLLKLEEDLNTDIFTGNNEEKAKNRWLRQAMITPCFVSTFYMSPKFFNSSRFLQKSDRGVPLFDNVPLYGFIDLLIVDEAGQVAPEVGIATFALARRAVVVGDVKQIEPVWNITPKMDVGNLKKGGLIRDYNDLVYEKVFDPKGFLASTGSIMKMAQNACCYQEEGLAEKGVLLVEHRRCYDEIINYCNELAYNGLLKPLKGKSIPDNPFPPMFCIHVEGNSNTSSSSRYNMQEVTAITDWLIANRQKIEQKYGRLEQAVGIITPFVGQKNNLIYALKEAGFDTSILKLGTVHALQGAERPIILFSMVYGKGDAGTMFFDRDNKPNMLNVAVSRAQDSFIVFANTAIFNKQQRTPSGILSNHVKFITERHLPN
ncbi:AAA domain-containing protein [Chitinophaga dinghuensis]|uniref:AAA domain-containing protein n=2 Tax=Chitinophaga dinghuensis TaxID=1539050 RepID=A0A327VXY2_9BACT|nr:AAA domain-containing protein [Chitinophaga dinghuensis]